MRRRYGENVMENTNNYLDELKSSVMKLLVADYDFTVEEAEETIEDSYKKDPEIWNVNAEPGDLAKSLASDDDED